ncbi:MAG: hypothetical protein HUU33_11760, partial [Flavobacteriales bacterium]|nr:hypothetical protein [Flavobacteriales bacterium]
MVDIGLFPGANPNTIEVRVRPDASFTQVVSSLTFTIRWNTASGANLDVANIAQDCPGGFFLSPSGDGEIDDSGFRYYTFNAFGFAQLAQACSGHTWSANVEKVVMTVPVINNTGCATFNIVNDSYTSANNKDYYISLNGLDRTDIIYSSAFNLGNCTEDCLGVIGGPALPGTACDDGNANTGNDTWDANCDCVGQVIDCLGVAGGPALPGTACDDGNANTGNDTWDANCN